MPETEAKRRTVHRYSFTALACVRTYVGNINIDFYFLFRLKTLQRTMVRSSNDRVARRVHFSFNTVMRFCVGWIDTLWVIFRGVSALKLWVRYEQPVAVDLAYVSFSLHDCRHILYSLCVISRRVGKHHLRYPDTRVKL